MYLLFFTNLIITKGLIRSVILNLQTEEIEIIPNSLADFILKFNKKDKQIIYKSFRKNDKLIIDEYIEWLEKKNFITWIQDKKTLNCFPEIKIQWEQPNHLSNIIIDIGTQEIKWEKIFSQVELHRIPFVQLRFFKEIKLEELNSLLLKTELSTIKGIEIYLPHYTGLDQVNIQNVTNKFLRIYQFVVYKAPQDNYDENLSKQKKVDIFFIKNNITSSKHCGIIDGFQFRANMSLFMEGNFFNTCLNGKISIDEFGNIRNCPSMNHSYGHISNTDFKTVIDNEQFKKLWKLTKNEVNICKACEFRMVCTDCRAFLQMPKDVYSKPLKCGYDPTTGKWEEWSKNPLNKKGIQYYDLSSLLTE